jgi:hypothetical protein
VTGLSSSLATSSGSSARSTTSTGSQNSIPTDAIVGIVIGGLALGVVATTLVISLILRRRRVRHQDRRVNFPICMFSPLSFISFDLPLLYRPQDVQFSPDARTSATFPTTAGERIGFTFQHF